MVLCNSAFKKVNSLLFHQAKEKKVLLDFEFDKNIIPFVFSDPTRIRQILYNIIGNSIKFTNQGSILIFLNSKKINHEFQEIEIKIQDTGIGIPKNKLPEIFNPFT